MNKLDFYFNKFPLVLIYILIFFLNFHQIISKYLFFYKEFFSLIFLTLSIIYFFYFKLKFFDLVFKSKLHIFLFPYLILILIFIFNIGNVDPEFTKSSTILKDDTEKYFLLLYTIRNFTILIPVVLFFSLRGIREYEINKLLLFLIFVGFMGFLIFSEVPTLSIYIGGLIIISTGIFIAYRERLNN